MKKSLLIVVVLLFALSLLAFSVAYSVRFNERAVVTTFGRADESAVVTEPGLKWKFPYPIQSVTKYDTRTQFARAEGEQQSTRDDAQIIVEAYALWRVTDPLQFYRRFSNAGPRAADHYRRAEAEVRSILRTAMSETSDYALSELFTAEGSKLPDLEADILRVLEANTTGENAYGLEVLAVGISNVRLTKDNSEDVIARMKADRQRLAQETLSRGDSQAQTITSRAENDARRIRDFATYLASEIRARGEREAGEIIAGMDEEPALAIYLAELELMKSMLGDKTTLVIDGTTPGVGLLDPNAFDNISGGGYPEGSLAGRLLTDPNGDQNGQPDATVVADADVPSASTGGGTR
ncbi:MAG: SPFH domain-containing protein [Planctomycetota bacterium]